MIMRHKPDCDRHQGLKLASESKSALQWLLPHAPVLLLLLMMTRLQ
jgi:hypothetical protein